MQQEQRDRTPKIALVGIALLVLLAVVAFASRSAFGHVSGASPTPAYVDWGMSVFLVLFVLMIPVALYAYSVQMREWRAQSSKRASMQSRIIRSLAIVAFIVVLLAFREFLRRRHELPAVHAFWLHSGTGRSAAPTAGNHYQPTFQWPVVWVTVALFVLAAAAAVWRYSRVVPEAEAIEQSSIADDVAASIDIAIDDLEAEPDARRAVIAAYARMERELGRHGFERRSSDTPIEYLRKVLLGMTARTDAVLCLTTLFERAKFSRHEIDGAMKTEAIGALRSIRDDLQAAPA
jgi:hypothetical protein